MLKIHLIVSLICYVLIVLGALNITYKLKRRGYKDKEKLSTYERFYIKLQLAIICLIPFVNLFIVLTFIFMEDQIIKSVTKKYLIKED